MHTCTAVERLHEKLIPTSSAAVWTLTTLLHPSCSLSVLPHRSWRFATEPTRPTTTDQAKELMTRGQADGELRLVVKRGQESPASRALSQRGERHFCS